MGKRTINFREGLRSFQAIVGFGLMFLGVLVGAYVGIVVCFVGGIVDIINEIKSPEAVEALTIAWALVKVLLSSTIGTITGVVIVLVGKVIVLTS